MTTIPQEKLRIETKKIPWDHIFLREAIIWSEKSHDAETRCGCVLVNDNTILSTGYNGFIRGIDDTILPNIRPYKYDFMMHSEINTILNCARYGRSTLGATAYITTKPCLQCFQFLYQAGINRIVYTNWMQSKSYNHAAADGKIDALRILIDGGKNSMIMEFIDVSVLTKL